MPAILGLAGCLSPQAQCFAAASAGYRALWRAAQEIEADLARGYALHRTETRALAPITCHEDGVRRTCLVEQRRDVVQRRPIDREDARARLAALRAEMDRRRPEAMAAAALCGDRAAPRPGPLAPTLPGS